MSDVLETVETALTTKIGPLPGWSYAVIVVGGVWGVYLYRKRSGLGVPVTAAPTVDGFTSAAPVTQGASTVTPVNNGTPPIATNAQWARVTADSLIATGQYSAIDVSNAISNYLNGAQLSAVQGAIIALALAHYGTPPEGVIPITVAPAAPAAPAPTLPPVPVAPVAPSAPAPPVAGHSYTVQRGDNLSSIASRFYGVQNWQKIYAANTDQISNPNLIYPGQVLTIPA